MSSKTALPIVFGAMTFGREGEEQVRTSKLEDCAAILDTFQSHGHNEIDTSRFYGVSPPPQTQTLQANSPHGGSSEEYLKALNWQTRGLTMDTKFFPNVHGMMGRPITHLDPSSMSSGLSSSLTALGCTRVDLWYLHAPDRSVPLQETLSAVASLHAQGKFSRWGISNYMSWEVAAICELCRANGWALPAVYQGVYNALHRTVEAELLPCLRYYGVAFYAFDPLAGGWLTGRYHRGTAHADVAPGSRFDANKMQGQMYRQRYWNGPFLGGARGAEGEEGGDEGGRDCAEVDDASFAA